MTSEPPAAADAPAPNHHADHAGFSGPSGLVAAVSFLFGRSRTADLAIGLSGLQPGERLVDIGCGPGVAAARAGEHGATVIGIDPAPVMLRVARIRWWRSDRLDWRIGTAEQIPVEDDTVDVVWSLATVHHWKEIDAGLTEIRRVLAPGGRLVAIEKQIADPEADGSASHGWTPAQAESFAAMGASHGFTDFDTQRHPGERALLSVVGRLPA